MTDFVSTESWVNPQKISDISSTALLPLGTRINAKDISSDDYGAGEFIYLLGVASTVLGSFVTVNEDDYSTTLLAANAIGKVAVAMGINVASSYGWYQIAGKASGLALAGFVDNANVYGTATAGSVDDAVVAGDRVQKCKGASAVDGPFTGGADFEIDNPYTNNALSD